MMLLVQPKQNRLQTTNLLRQITTHKFQRSEDLTYNEAEDGFSASAFREQLAC